ncbi:UNVERIFIED_CONTAM: NAC domain-containing protein 30 [Sesamum radiatum]|uniref:NAC domain-containing protein 30 n=1 Tax=Sesamum radiatum TaxID=300843 RepID=A0AAW2M5E1_SESRA
MEMESCVPPGFRFHPTEEELVGYYLKRKVNSLKIDLDVIMDIDLYRMEPWDIEGTYTSIISLTASKPQGQEVSDWDENQQGDDCWFLEGHGKGQGGAFKGQNHRDEKTLVFYKGRAPNGRKTDWIMHEYRLQTSEHAPPQEEGWVVCRAFKKPNPSHKQALISTGESQGYSPFESQVVELPKLDSPSISTSFATNDTNFEHSFVANEETEDEKSNFGNQFSDWNQLLATQVTGVSSYAYTNMPLLPNSDDELDAQNHLSHVLDQCFPDL